MTAASKLTRPRMPRVITGELKTQSVAIDHVALRGFKGHKKLDLDMGRITVLIGPTNSGKSTVFQALNLLQSALENEAGRILDRNGGQDHGQFTDIATGGNENAEVGISVRGRKTVQARKKYTVDTKFVYSATFDASLHPARLDAVVDMTCGPDTQGAGSAQLNISSGLDEVKATVSGAGTPDGSPVHAVVGRGLTPRVQAQLSRSPLADAFGYMFSNGAYFRSLLDEVRHVPFSRVVTAYEHPIEPSASILSPDRALAAASLISDISSDNAAREKISNMLDAIGLRRVEVRTLLRSRIKGNALALDLAKNGSRHNVVHEGSGLNQMVAMLAILANSPGESVVTIEEPEIHLDPAAQARLMKIVVDQAVEERKQVVFTTHSDHLLYPLLAYIEKDGHPLEGSDVAMYYFDTDESGAVAGAERLAINERGQIKGGLKGFWDADMRAMGDILG